MNEYGIITFKLMEDGMPLAEDKALEILTELIKKPETKAEDIPRIWNEILDVYNKAYAPAPEVAVKKRRRRVAGANVGWPAGVKRAEYNTWKEAQQARGITENLNPQEYKRQRDAGLIDTSAPAAAEESAEAKPKRGRPAKK